MCSCEMTNCIVTKVIMWSKLLCFTTKHACTERDAVLSLAGSDYQSIAFASEENNQSQVLSSLSPGISVKIETIFTGRKYN